MLRYPGGTTLDARTPGYSISRNFLSDLGRTVAYNGERNYLGASFFVASAVLLNISLGARLLTIISLYWADRRARQWVLGAAACGLLACGAFVGVAVTPENRVMAIHIRFTMWGWRLAAIVATLMAVAAAKSSFRRRLAVVWTLLAAVLGGYALLLAWGPSLSSVDGLRTQVLAQKVATVLLTLALVYVAREADRARYDRRRIGRTMPVDADGR